MFVFEADARERSKRQPPFRRRTLHDADRDPGAKQPEERLESIHGKETVEGEIRRGEQNRCGRKKLPEAPAAEFASHHAGKKNHSGAGEHRQKANREKRVAENVARNPGDDGYQRWLVHVAPGEMLAAGHIVKLVAKNAVMIDPGKLDEQLRDGQTREHGRGARSGLARGSANERGLAEFAGSSLAHARCAGACSPRAPSGRKKTPGCAAKKFIALLV